ncbi:MAG: DUF5995 family protein [Candidatus Promineifilaceae bacterium]
MQAKTIDEVITHLDEIIAWSRTHHSRLGYFAALYRRVTVQVKQNIAAGNFENNARMEQLDVIFANRYLAAFYAYRDGKPVTTSWQIAFDAAPEWRPIVLQHLLVGMNAHINLDLGIAAAQIAPGDLYEDLHHDFNQINTILAGLVDDVKTELSEIWRTLALLSAVAGGAEDAIINFSMSIARDEAWRFGKRLAPLDAAARAAAIEEHDKEIAKLGELSVHPPLWSSFILLIIRLGERGNVRQIIDILA